MRPQIIHSRRPRLGAVLRAARRRADLSQRELARLAGVPVGTVARVESERGADPRLRTVEKLLAVMDLRLAVLTSRGDARELLPAAGDGDLRDGAGRRYPPHLDVRPVRTADDWWGAWWNYEIPRGQWPVRPPDNTFDLRRARRDRRRYGDISDLYDDIDVDENEL